MNRTQQPTTQQQHNGQFSPGGELVLYKMIVLQHLQLQDSIVDYDYPFTSLWSWVQSPMGCLDMNQVTQLILPLVI